MTEPQLTRKIIRALRKIGGRYIQVIKVHGSPYQQRGIADILVCYCGHFIALEVKRPGKERNLSAYQEAFLANVAEAGGASALVTSVTQAIKLIRDTKKKGRQYV